MKRKDLKPGTIFKYTGRPASWHSNWLITPNSRGGWDNKEPGSGKTIERLGLSTNNPQSVYSDCEVVIWPGPYPNGLPNPYQPRRLTDADWAKASKSFQEFLDEADDSYSCF